MSNLQDGEGQSRGWIKLHRRLINNPRFADPEWLAVWVYLLLNATHQRMRAIFEGKAVELHPGQLISGRLSIAKKTGVNASKVYRVLETLKSEHQIEQQAGSKNSIFTVVNWHLYQDFEQQNGQQPSSKRAAAEQQPNTNKKGKNEENVEEGGNGRPLPKLFPREAAAEEKRLLQELSDLPADSPHREAVHKLLAQVQIQRHGHVKTPVDYNGGGKIDYSNPGAWGNEFDPDKRPEPDHSKGF